jgi:hypothetical protein
MNLGSVDSPGTVKALNKLVKYMEQENSVRSIKAELAKGQVVIRDRQTGKTTALLEFVHEHDPANMIVVCCNRITKALILCRYREMFPKDARPSVISIHNVNDSDVRGTNRRWVTDEVWPAAVVRRARSYSWAEYAGGVGTPMCMDAFSGQWLTGEETEKPESPQPVFTQVSDGKRKSNG